MSQDKAKEFEESVPGNDKNVLHVYIYIISTKHVSNIYVYMYYIHLCMYTEHVSNIYIYIIRICICILNMYIYKCILMYLLVHLHKNLDRFCIYV